jgi:hypothetical protein
LPGIRLHQHVAQLPEFEKRIWRDIHHTIDNHNELFKSNHGPENRSALQVPLRESHEAPVAGTATEDAAQVYQIYPVPIVTKRKLAGVHTAILAHGKRSIIIK